MEPGASQRSGSPPHPRRPSQTHLDPRRCRTSRWGSGRPRRRASAVPWGHSRHPWAPAVRNPAHRSAAAAPRTPAARRKPTSTHLGALKRVISHLATNRATKVRSNGVFNTDSPRTDDVGALGGPPSHRGVQSLLPKVRALSPHGGRLALLGRSATPMGLLPPLPPRPHDLRLVRGDSLRLASQLDCWNRCVGGRKAGWCTR